MKKVKARKEITYQEAWNKISEYMNKSEFLSFIVSPWNENDDNRYTLEFYNNDDKKVICFEADNKWEHATKSKEVLK